MSKVDETVVDETPEVETSEALVQLQNLLQETQDTLASYVNRPTKTGGKRLRANMLLLKKMIPAIKDVTMGRA